MRRIFELGRTMMHRGDRTLASLMARTPSSNGRSFKPLQQLAQQDRSAAGKNNHRYFPRWSVDELIDLRVGHAPPMPLNLCPLLWPEVILICRARRYNPTV